MRWRIGGLDSGFGTSIFSMLVESGMIAPHQSLYR